MLLYQLTEEHEIANKQSLRLWLCSQWLYRFTSAENKGKYERRDLQVSPWSETKRPYAQHSKEHHGLYQLHMGTPTAEDSNTTRLLLIPTFHISIRSPTGIPG